MTRHFTFPWVNRCKVTRKCKLQHSRLPKTHLTFRLLIPTTIWQMLLRYNLLHATNLSKIWMRRNIKLSKIWSSQDQVILTCGRNLSLTPIICRTTLKIINNAIIAKKKSKSLNYLRIEKAQIYATSAKKLPCKGA